MTDEPERLRPVIYIRRRRRRPADIVSGIIYSIAVVVSVALGAMFYGAYQKARKDAAPRYAPSDLPGKVVGVVTSALPAEPAPARPSAPAEPAPAKPPGEEPGLKPIVVAVQREPGRMPEIRPGPRVPWGSLRGDIPNALRAKLLPLADTVVAAPPLQDRNGGALRELPLDGADRVALARYDLEPVRGWTVTRATWRCKVAKGRLSTLGFSAVPLEWQEGGGDLSAAADAGATYQSPDAATGAPWTPGRLPLPALMRGKGGSIACFAEPDNPENGPGDWVAYELRPEVVQALVAGSASGLAIMDEKGQLQLGAAFASREEEEAAHFLEVDGRALDLVPPALVEGFYAYAHPDLRAARTCGALLTWLAPGDDEMQGQAFRYDIRYTPGENPKPFDEAERMEASSLPLPLPAGHEEVFAAPGLRPDTEYLFYIRACDESGQFGEIAQASVTTAPPLALEERIEPRSFDGAPVDLALGQVALEVLDEMTVAGALPIATGSYVWDKASRSLHLVVPAGDVAALALRFRPKSPAVSSVRVEATATLAPGGEDSGIAPRFFDIRGGTLAQSEGGLDFAGDGESVTLLVEYAVPPGARPGLYRTKLKVVVPDKPEANLNVFLAVADVALGAPVFRVELAAELAGLSQEVEQGLPSLAQDHRLAFTPIPYTARGEAKEPFAPGVTGSGKDLKIASWDAWDARFAPYLDAPSGFALLPVFEGWPTPFVEGYTCADQEIPVARGRKAFAGPGLGVPGCISREYGEALAVAAGEFGTHFADAGREQLDGHIWFLNGPVEDYAGFTPPWDFGNPRTRDDLTALATLCEGVRGGAHRWRGGRLVIRATVPDLRVFDDSGSGVFNILAVADTNLCLWSMIKERVQRNDETVWLQTGDPGASDPGVLAGLVLGAFLLGADGWTIVTPGRGIPASLIGAEARPSRTALLALVRRLQADIDLLAQLQAKRGWTRAQLGEFVRQYATIQDCRPVMSPQSLRLLRQATLEALAKGGGG